MTGGLLLLLLRGVVDGGGAFFVGTELLQFSSETEIGFEDGVEVDGGASSSS